jgi:P-type Cu+ transporter
MASMNTFIEEVISCYHCGEASEDDAIEFDDKIFCCNGCKMVYEILQENDLCNYYDLQNSPGVTFKNRHFDEKFAFLDNLEIQEKLLSYSSETLGKIIFLIPAIHCSSCIWLLEHLDTLNEGIITSRVNFGRKDVSIDFNPKLISLKSVVELLTTIGYEPEISLQNISTGKLKKENRRLFLQIGVAGFCFGNIMLLSLPEYLGFEGLDVNIQRFMSFAIVVLSLPVVFFSASNYFSSAFKGMAKKYINIDVPIALGIITLFGRSLYDIATSSGSGYLDSLAGLAFFLLIGKWFQSKTYANLSFERDYKSYLPLAVTKIADGDKCVAQVLDLVAGDLIEVKNREVIPADAILMSSNAAIDYSFVTGEAEAIQKKKGDKIYAGGRQVGHAIQLQVIKEVSQSYLTQLWNRDTFQESGKYDSLVDSISKYFTSAVLIIAITTGFYWYWVEPANVLNSVTAVLIVACPCALALATPFTLGSAMSVLGRHKFYLKHMNVIEHLWRVTLIVFDKTGTLTKVSSGNVHFNGALSQFEKNIIAAATGSSTHPLSRMIYAETYASENVTPSVFEEHEGLGIMAVVNGKKVMLGSAKWIGSKAVRNDAKTVVYLSIDGKVKGHYAFGNVYREKAQEAISDLNQYKLAILSGDNESEIDKLTQLFPAGTEMMFNQRPEDKLDFIGSKQEEGESVVMFGDGLNDAGALKQADVGIAVTDDISSFTPAADAILYGGKFPFLGKYLKFAKSTKKVIIASFTLSFIYNLAGLSFAVTANLSPLFAAILMPLSSISVVAFATFAVRGIAYKQGL